MNVTSTTATLASTTMRRLERETELALAEPAVSFLITRRVASIARQTSR